MQEPQFTPSGMSAVKRFLIGKNKLRTLLTEDPIPVIKTGCPTLDWEREQKQLLLLSGKSESEFPARIVLRSEIRLAEDWTNEIRSLVKILDNKRENLGRLDSGIRLQQATIEAELRMYPPGVPLPDSLEPTEESTRRSEDVSMPSGDSSNLMGLDNFDTLTQNSDVPQENTRASD